MGLLTDRSFSRMSHVFVDSADDDETADAGIGLLEDDPLRIPLQDRAPIFRHPGRQYTRKKVTSWVGSVNCPAHRTRRLGSCLVAAMMLSILLVVVSVWSSLGISEGTSGLLPCGGLSYAIDEHTCYNSNFLCPVIDRQRTLKCGHDCYLPKIQECTEGRVVAHQGADSNDVTHHGETLDDCASTYLYLSDPPYENYFISDCSSASQVVVTSPLQDSNLDITRPRLLVAWPAGNSGIAAYFSPENGVKGTLEIALSSKPGANRTVDTLVGGVSGILSLNSSAILDVPILGSIRTIRNYVEGGGSLVPRIQAAIDTTQLSNGGVLLNRQWLDNTTETYLSFESTDNRTIAVEDGQPHFPGGTYTFKAWSNYPQLEQLRPEEVLNPASQGLIIEGPDIVKSLSFFSYTEKIVAGGWRFLTYFGRDSLISLLLLRPVLSEGPNSAVEAILSAAIERINWDDGSVCHEENIGDYATYLNEEQGINSTDAQCDYKMVDTDLFLPVAMNDYFVGSAIGQGQRDSFLAMEASVLKSNSGRTYEQLVLLTMEKVMNITADFESSPDKKNLIHLRENEVVGQWRDSATGLGGGRIPYDVNTALVPASLKAIASMSSQGLFPSHPEWADVAQKRAIFWEENTLSFFAVNIPVDEARQLVEAYVDNSGFPGTVNTSELTSPVSFYGLALDGTGNQPVVKVMNTDDCFRLFFLNTTNQNQLSTFLSQIADNILRPFPLGLSTSVGLLVANPAYAGGSVNIDDFTTTSYHGTVVWSWQLAMMAVGLERQISRCDAEQLGFCADSALHGRVVEAYNHLWDVIDANREHLSSEVWTWVYRDGDFQYTPIGALSATESDIRQLWSLAFLAVKRKDLPVL